MKTFSAIGAAVSAALFSSAALAEADIEYGEYLSSECVTCHVSKPSDAQIPVIHGMDAEAMDGILKMYRAEILENEAMRTVAKRLTDEEIASLAAYFASLPEPE